MGLTVNIICPWELSQACGPRLLYVASPCGLGFSQHDDRILSLFALIYFLVNFLLSQLIGMIIPKEN